MSEVATAHFVTRIIVDHETLKLLESDVFQWVDVTSGDFICFEMCKRAKVIFFMQTTTKHEDNLESVSLDVISSPSSL